MKIILAKNIGFCSGVKRAVLIAEKSLKEDKKPIQFLGSLIHNEKVVEKFKKNGVKFIKNLKETEPGALIIQAHGFPPLPEDFNKKIIVRDATCPLVKRVQNAANSLFEQGHQVIIIGDKNHPEVKGIKGYTGNKTLIIENESQVKKLKRMKKIGVVSQTTQNLDKVNKILNVLRKKAENFQWINTLCPEVQTRQKELGLLLKKADGILVIGSKKSANTGKLVQICQNVKKPVWQVNSLLKIQRINLADVKKLGIVSGTSTPDWEIDKIKKWLSRKQK